MRSPPHVHAPQVLRARRVLDQALNLGLDSRGLGAALAVGDDLVAVELGADGLEGLLSLAELVALVLRRT